MSNMYDEIFKRKSFHLFRGSGSLSQSDIEGLEEFIESLKHLDESIKTDVKIVPASETTCKRGGEYCILFYSKRSGEYLRNIGYIGEQIDLYCAAHDIGSLWFGIGRPKKSCRDDMDYVIMIAIAKMPSDKFRKDMFKAKRKPLDEIWYGSTLGVREIVRFTPSACNTQPWFVEHKSDTLYVYRYKKPGKRGIMPKAKVVYYNRIDMGIFMFMLEICLTHEGYEFERKQYPDTEDDAEKVLVAEYKLNLTHEVEDDEK